MGIIICFFSVTINLTLVTFPPIPLRIIFISTLISVKSFISFTAVSKARLKLEYVLYPPFLADSSIASSIDILPATRASSIFSFVKIIRVANFKSLIPYVISKTSPLNIFDLNISYNFIA